MSQHDFIPLFLHKAATAPDGVFARFQGSDITFGAIERAASAFAGSLTTRGLAAGSRVAVMMHNAPETIAVIVGLARIGAIWIPVNARSRGDGLRYILDHCDPQAMVVEEDFLPTITESGADLSRAWTIRAGQNSALATILEGAPCAPVELPKPDAPFAIMYTSGTTGRPKGVIVTHRMLRLAGDAVATLTRAQAGDVFFVWEPLYHIGGAQLLVLPLIREVRLAMAERFSASRFWDEVRAAGATHIHYLGGVLQLLLKQPPRPDDRDHSVRIAWGAGCQEEIWPSFEKRFGVAIRECYGMTEASSVTTFNDDGIPGCVGRPMPWFTVDLQAPDGSSVERGERGEIVVRTDLPGAIFPGYFRNEEATGKALKEGALHTGDLGSFDAAGDLWFHGRMTDNVRCRGENVSAWEVEHVAAQHPAVEDCAMIGVAADIGEQDIKLFVKPKAGAIVEAGSLFAWLAARLASYQVPRYLAVVGTFERTPSERIMKHRLSTSREDCWDRLHPDESALLRAVSP